MTCLCHTSDFNCRQGRDCPRRSHPAMTAPINRELLDMPITMEEPHPDLWVRADEFITAAIPRLLYAALGASLVLAIFLASF